MTDYLIRHITDSTGHTFTEVIKPRENERYEIVSAESKEDAEEMAKRPKGLLNYVKSSFNDSRIVSFDRPSEETMESLFGKDYKKGQWVNMFKLSEDILEKIEGLESLDKEHQKELEDEFLKSIRDENGPMYSKFMSNMSDEYLLGMFRIMLSGLKTQINRK